MHKSKPSKHSLILDREAAKALHAKRKEVQQRRKEQQYKTLDQTEKGEN